MATGGGLAVIRSDGMLQVISLAGGRVRWSRPGLPGQTQVQVQAGLALVTSNGTGRYTKTASGPETHRRATADGEVSPRPRPPRWRILMPVSTTGPIPGHREIAR